MTLISLILEEMVLGKIHTSGIGSDTSGMIVKIDREAGEFCNGMVDT